MSAFGIDALAGSSVTVSHLPAVTRFLQNNLIKAYLIYKNSCTVIVRHHCSVLFDGRNAKGTPFGKEPKTPGEFKLSRLAGIKQ